MSQLRRVILYIAVFIGLLAIAIYLPLSSVDYRFYRAFFLGAESEIELHRDELLLIDLPARSNSTNVALENFRHRLSDLLENIAIRGVRPKAVILDYYFSNNDVGVERLHSAIARVENIGDDKYTNPVDVVHVLDLKDSSIPLQKILENHNTQLYENPHSYAHSIFNVTHGVLSYESQIEVPGNLGTHLITAMPLRVTHESTDDMAKLPPERVLALGDSSALSEITYSYMHDPDTVEDGRFFSDRNQSAEVKPSAFDKYIVIGSLLEDNEYGDRPGPEILLWAISDQLSRNSAAKQPLTHPVAIFAQIIGFAAVSVICFALLFSYIKKLRTRPILLALMSVFISLILFAAYAGIVLQVDIVVPVALTILAIILGALLSLHFVYRYLVTGAPEGSAQYDIFISYSRAHGNWVTENVYKPLQNHRTSEGEALNIFFDKDKIGAGEAFTSKYMWAIVNSKYFLPVFSGDYYNKNHCRNEMDLAYKRYVDKKLHLLPLLYGGDIPEIYSTLNFIDSTENQSFITDIENRIENHSNT